MTDLRYEPHDPRCDCENGSVFVKDGLDPRFPDSEIEYRCRKCGPVASLRLTEGEVREGLERLRAPWHIQTERILNKATVRMVGPEVQITREIVYDGSFEIDWLAADPGCPECQGSGMQYDEISDTFQQGTCIARCRRYDLTGIDRMVLDYDLCEWSKGMDCSYECSICERIAAARDAAEAAGLEVIDA